MLFCQQTFIVHASLRPGFVQSRVVSYAPGPGEQLKFICVPWFARWGHRFSHARTEARPNTG